VTGASVTVREKFKWNDWWDRNAWAGKSGISANVVVDNFCVVCQFLCFPEFT